MSFVVDKKEVKKNSGTQVLRQSDLLSAICSFLSIIDIFGNVSPLCQFYYQFINNPQQLKLIKKCINYQRGENDGLTIILIMEKIGLKLIYLKQNHPFGLSLSEQVNMIIDYWKKWDKYLTYDDDDRDSSYDDDDSDTDESDEQVNNDDESTMEKKKEKNFPYHLKQLREEVSAIDYPFACHGSIPIEDERPFRLVIFGDTKNNNHDDTHGHVGPATYFEINSNMFDEYEIEKLKSFMKPASFAFKNQTKYDPTYRNSLQLSNESFSFIFNNKKQEFQILDEVRRILVPDSDYNIYHELYKLNFMSKGGFFKQHIDTPHSNNFIGTLVLCLPICKFKGGNLMIWKLDDEEATKQEKRLNCDFSKNVNAHDENKGNRAEILEWCAFYGDCGHEVLPVTDGNRVTVTFNLYYSHINDHPEKKDDGNEIDHCNCSYKFNYNYQNIDTSVTNFEKYFYIALCNCDFLPYGGRIGFGCEYQYPVSMLNTATKEKSDSISIAECTSIRMCKGKDAIIWLSIKQRFSFLQHRIVPLISNNESLFQMKRFPDATNPNRAIEDYDDSAFFDEFNAVNISEDMYPELSYEQSRREKLHWLNYRNDAEEQTSQAVHSYGNEWTVHHCYVFAAIVIEIPSFQKRIKLIQKLCQ